MVIAEVNVFPLGTSTPSVSKWVAHAFGVLRDEKNIKYELTAMGTIIEGELGDILRVVRKMHEATFVDGLTRVVTTVKIDDRRDKPSTMKGKVESVQKNLES